MPDPTPTFRVPRVLFVLALAGLIGAAGCAQNEDTFPGQPVTKRRALLQETLRTFEPMGAMVQGKKPYDAAAFQALAATLKTLAPQPWAHFPAGSTYHPSRAKPAVWTQPERFKQAQDTYIQAVDALADTASSGDLAAIGPAYTRVKNTCSECHKDFRGPPVL